MEYFRPGEGFFYPDLGILKVACDTTDCGLPAFGGFPKRRWGQWRPPGLVGTCMRIDFRREFLVALGLLGGLWVLVKNASGSSSVG